jgi:hypothetical protein
MFTSRGMQDQRITRSVGLPACRWTQPHLYLSGLGHLAVPG